MSQPFKATNGVFIQFKIRDCPRNFYRVWNPREPKEHELQVNDDGTMRIFCDDPIPQSWIDAYQEFTAKEKADYLAWKAEFEKKYGPIVESSAVK